MGCVCFKRFGPLSLTRQALAAIIIEASRGFDRGAFAAALPARVLLQVVCSFLCAMPLLAMSFASLFVPPQARGVLLGLAVLTVAAWPAVQAAPIYQCKQVGGGVAFQEKPCAPSDAQAILKPTTGAAPAQAASAATASRSTLDAPAAPGNERAVCHQAGRKIFDPTRPQELQHPQAALNLCKKTVPDTFSANGPCLEACVQAWVAEYQKKYTLPQQ